MKFLSFLSYFTLSLLCVLVLSAALSILIIPSSSPNIEHILSITRASAQIRSTDVWDAYESQKHEIA
jgi:hypothetical protein